MFFLMVEYDLPGNINESFEIQTYKIFPKFQKLLRNLKVV